MRLVTIRTPEGHRAGVLEGDTVIELRAPDVAALLASGQTPDPEPTATRHDIGSVRLAAVVPCPGKIVCVGLNYRTHILEMGREIPTAPTLFAKFADTLLGPHDDLVLPQEEDAVDWEAELAVIVGSTVRRASAVEAVRAIGGYAVANDVSMRTWQTRTKEWLQGKAWDSSTPLGPSMVTPDEWQPGPEILTQIGADVLQRASTADLVHDPVDLIRYISTIATLRPGDVILTGTPGGVGHARRPPRYLRDGDVLQTTIDGLGTLRNAVRSETPRMMTDEAGGHGPRQSAQADASTA